MDVVVLKLCRFRSTELLLVSAVADVMVDVVGRECCCGLLKSGMMEIEGRLELPRKLERPEDEAELVATTTADGASVASSVGVEEAAAAPLAMTAC